MKCVNCGSKSVVIDTTPWVKDVYRKRKCRTCGKTFYTIEAVIPSDNDRMKMAFANKWSKEPEKQREHNKHFREKQKGRNEETNN